MDKIIKKMSKLMNEIINKMKKDEGNNRQNEKK